MKPNMISRIAGLTVLAFAMTAGVAYAGLGPRSGAIYKYEVRALGAKVGEAKLSISGFKNVGKRRLREVTLEASTTGMGATVYKSNTKSTSWVDAAWMPVKAKWAALTPKGKRLLKADYFGKTARGVYQRQGVKDYPTNFRMKIRPTDLVSFFAMIPNKRLKPGQKFSIPLYDGWRMFNMKAKVGRAKIIHVPYKGKVSALPVVVEAKTGKLTRNVVYWIDAKTHEPLKLSFSFGMLGSVDAVLMKVKRV